MKRKTRNYSFENFGRKRCWIDVETTGLDPKKSEIVQLAAVMEIDGKQVSSFDTFIRPSIFNPDNGIPDAYAEAFNVNGITQQELAAASSQEIVFTEFNQWLGRYIDKLDKTDKAVFCGYNTRFDMDFMRDWWRKQGDRFFGSWFYPVPLDTLANFVNLFAVLAPHLLRLPANMKLETLCDYYNILIEVPHDALSDIEATIELNETIRKVSAGL